MKLLKYPLLLSLFIISTCDSTETTSSAPNNEYELVWEDEFDRSTLDQSNWTYELGTGAQYGLNGWGNNELQYYTDRTNNLYLENGFLVIEAKREDYEGQDYTSARIKTQNKQDWSYGTFEIRAKLPKSQGIWPAIWMMPTNSEYGGWPRSGEIDIMELLGHQPDTVYGTVHFGNSFSDKDSETGSSSLSDSDYSEDFHVYKIIWLEESITWYIDDEQFHKVVKDDLTPYVWPFDKSFYMILNVAVGGNWPGNPDQTTILPQRMIVDYVKVYQKN
jgi:beta-glucanase (GH16 family)